MRFIFLMVLFLVLGGCTSPFLLIHPEDERYQAKCKAPGFFGELGFYMEPLHCTKGRNTPRK